MFNLQFSLNRREKLLLIIMLIPVNILEWCYKLKRRVFK